MDEITDEKRRATYEKLRQASERIDEAAQILGYDNVHEILREGNKAEDDLPTREIDALRAITHAHSYLNNGQIEALLPEGERRP